MNEVNLSFFAMFFLLNRSRSAWGLPCLAFRRLSSKGIFLPFRSPHERSTSSVQYLISRSAVAEVRDVYQLGNDQLLIVPPTASPSMSSCPRASRTRSRVLTGLSNFWFAFFRKEFPGTRDHLIETDVNKFPADLQAYKSQLIGRAVICKETKVLPIECIVRALYHRQRLEGLSKKLSIVSGIKLPPGLKQCQQLPGADLHAFHQGRGRATTDQSP